MKRINFLTLIICILVMVPCCKSAKTTSSGVINMDSSRSISSENISIPQNNSNSFTLVAIPDTQGYSDYFAQIKHNKSYPCNQYEMNDRQMQFIARNSVRNGGDFACAIHLGDFVNEGAWYKYEWKLADQSLSYLNNNIPLLNVIGNHDYDNLFMVVAGNAKWLKGQRMYNKYFGPKSKYFKDKDFFGGSTKDGLNTWITFTAADKTFLVIGLELEPSDNALLWSQEVIDSHPDLPVIIATHSYINLGKESNGNATFTGHKYRENGNAASDVYNRLVHKNKNIFMVLCGHVSSGDAGENSRIDINEAGYPVYTLLSDYQTRKSIIKERYPEYTGKIRYCGDGWLRLMKFDFDANTIHVQTYSTEYNRYETDADSDFVLPINWNWEERFSN